MFNVKILEKKLKENNVYVSNFMHDTCMCGFKKIRLCY